VYAGLMVMFQLKKTASCRAFTRYQMAGTLALFFPFGRLSAGGLSVGIREEVFSLSLSNYFRFGSFFYKKKLL
jgi:hypothetical protein